jgi:Arc/MetJ-type ribon-helix-helix transcriptional regulator
MAHAELPIWAVDMVAGSGVLRYPRSVAMCITFRHTEGMAKAISVRLDDEAERALRLLESTGLSRSEAIRSSLLASADRMRRRSQLAAEVAALEVDADDRSEMYAVASLMESMRAAG